MASLFVIQGPDRGRRYELAEVSVTIGRERFQRDPVARYRGLATPR